MAKKKKSPSVTSTGYAQTSGVPITLNGNSHSVGSWYLSQSSAGSLTFAVTPTFTSGVGIKDLRSHLFKVDIGDYDSTVVTSLIRSVEFIDEKLVVSFLLDDKDTIREAFTEYHFFRLSYLNTKGDAVETYEIKTDPIAETKYILPNVRHDSSDIPNWKLVWSPYTVTRVEKGT